MPTSQVYFEKKIPLYNFQWKVIYSFSRKVTISQHMPTQDHCSIKY